MSFCRNITNKFRLTDPSGEKREKAQKHPFMLIQWWFLRWLPCFWQSKRWAPSPTSSLLINKMMSWDFILTLNLICPRWKWLFWNLSIYLHIFTKQNKKIKKKTKQKMKWNVISEPSTSKILILLLFKRFVTIQIKIPYHFYL